MSCPSPEHLATLVVSRRDEMVPGLLEHLDGCVDCRRILAAALDSTPAEPLGPLLEPRSRFDRYEVHELLGVGAMGAVYAGFDPELGRKVALKLVRQGLAGSAETRASLLAEAQLMARINHPNVRAIYDIVFAHERCCLVMELVEGETLSTWLAGGRGWRETARQFLLAGRGLAAAHQAGLVHRDFKPSNVLVDSDGRVRVTDFGLALAEPMRGGELAGTYAFMAPEQRRGEAADAQSDQYAFCRALELALRDDAPAWLRKLIATGCAQAPHDRFPSMQPLLDALERRLAPRRALPRLAAAAALLGLTVSAGLLLERRTRCKVDPELLLGPDRLGAAAASFAATQLPYAGASWSRVSATLAGFQRRWVAEREEACAATQLRGEQPEPLMQARYVCLERRRFELAALLDSWTHADAKAVEGAAAAADALARRPLCDGLDELAAEPAAPHRAPEWEPVQRALAAARALAERQDNAAGLARLAEVLPAARTLDHALTLSRLQLLRGTLLTRADQLGDAEAALDEAIRMADRGRSPSLRVEAWVALIIARTRATHLQAALEAGKHGRAALESLHRPNPSLTTELDLAEARALALSGEPALALERLDEALKRPVDARLSRDGRLLRGNVLIDLGRGAEARALLEQVVEDSERLDGSSHPVVAQALVALSAACSELKDDAGALAANERALPIREATLGKRHRLVAGVLTNMGVVLKRLNRPIEAEARLSQAIEMLEDIDPQSMQLFFPLQSLGELRLHEARVDEALRVFERARTLVSSRDASPRSRTNAHVNLAEALIANGRGADALVAARVAAEQAQSPSVPEPLRQRAALLVAEALFLEGHVAEARGAYAPLEAAALAPELVGALELGQARLAAERDGELAVRLARSARERFVAAAHLERVAQADALLATLAPPARLTARLQR